jgi:tryptophanyl-tRNA synthetase
MNNFISEIRDKRKYYEENPELVDKILKDGTEKARQIAKEQMQKVRKSMKIDY